MLEYQPNKSKIKNPYIKIMSKFLKFAATASVSICLSSSAYASQIFDPIKNQQGFSVNCVNTGVSGACTKYSQLISNATGNTFVPVGYNVNFGYYDKNGADGLPASYHYLTDGYPNGSRPIQSTGANTVRLWTGQWAGNPTQSVGNAFPTPGYDSQTAGYARLIQASLQGGVVPILSIAETNSSMYNPSDPTGLSYPTITSSTGTWSVPNATPVVINGNYGGTIGLSTSVGKWITPQMLNLLNNNPDLIVNITNEWGQPMSTVNPNDVVYNKPAETYWANSYKYAINVLRAAGINNLFNIDATGGGTYADGIIQDGVSIENSDPLRKVVFSAHAYGIYNDSKDCNLPGFTKCSTITPNEYQYDLATELNALADAGVPVTIGEFGNSYFNGNNFNYQNLVTQANQNKLGWGYWLYSNPGDAIYEQPYLDGVLRKLSANPNYQLQPVSGANVPFEFSPIQGFILGLPSFLGLRYLKKKNKR